MVTPTQLDSICFNPSSSVYGYNVDLSENIVTPAVVAAIDPHKKNVNNPLKGLVEIARNEKVKCIALMISPGNESTQQMCQRLGFALDQSQEMGMIEAWLEF